MSPKISIVTPNFNGEEFLEQTILSVISQKYPNLEYILVDGGSTDGSMRIVEQYRNHFSQVISEPDAGHADALNKGFALATGEIMGWINSDDFLLPHCLERVCQVFSVHKNVQWITGIPSTADPTGKIRHHPMRSWTWQRFLCGDYRHIQQESTFWRASLWTKAGGKLDIGYQLANDFELWLRFFEQAALYTLDAPLGCFRSRPGQRSISQADIYEKECDRALSEYINRLPSALLAPVIQHVPNEQLGTRRGGSPQVPPAIASFDTPVIKLCESQFDTDFVPQSALISPNQYRPEHSYKEDLIFDGLERIYWQSGPNFNLVDLVALEVDIVPFAPAAIVIDPLSDTSPPMPFIVGPVSLSDWGAGRHTLQIQFSEGTVTHDLSLSEAGKNYRLKILLEATRYIVILNGVTQSVGETRGRQRMQSASIMVGGGHAHRFWLGAFGKVSVSTVKKTNFHDQLDTHELIHCENWFDLPRQKRATLTSHRYLNSKFREPVSSLLHLRDIHKGQRCFVMGNGPSLNKMDLSKLQGETVFACNSIFLLFNRIDWRPKYYTCVDTRVIRDRAEDILSMLEAEKEMAAFFPAIVHLHDGSGREFPGRNIIPPGKNRYYFNEVGNRESHHVETMFSLDADDYVVQPYTVAITMLQLALFMGFEEIYLIGCDTSYKVPNTVKQEGVQIDGVGLLLTSTKDDDNNHFDPSYFGRGREWHNPQVNKMLEHYRWARLAARRKGVRIFNATEGGQLEVFERVRYDSLFPRPVENLRFPAPDISLRFPLLSIAIPAYDRPEPLLLALKKFVSQIEGRFEQQVEIVVSDDCTPGDRLKLVRQFAANYPFVRWRKYSENIGLERNLIACAQECVGEYLWLFGDDDYLETDNALERILGEIKNNAADFIVLNRTRRSADLSKLISQNWMELNPSQDRKFAGLANFCLEFGFISVLGFISVNVFRRRFFQRVQVEKYFGTMYPQLGAMLEAFHGRPTLLISEPLVCHRTESAEEKKKALGDKPSESTFMADVRRRNATYFSHPYVAMLDELMACGAFCAQDIVRIPENTVIKGLLIDFIINCIKLNDEMGIGATAQQWERTAKFLDALPLASHQAAKVASLVAGHSPARHSSARTPRCAISISAVTPSFNQAEFLPACLDSVRDQSYQVMEHLVFDPGSTDRSREIAASYSHVTLLAESDDGQSDALNKGFLKAKGDIIVWLNSDDMLADSDVLERVVSRFEQPDAPDIVYGRGIYIDENGAKLRDAYINSDPSTLIWKFHQEDGIMQPALFMRKSVIQRVGLLRGDLHFSMDYEYWIRCIKNGIRFVFMDSVLAQSRYHLSNKTYGQRGSSYEEVCRMTREHFGYVNHVWLRRYSEFLAEGHDGVLAHSGNAGIQDKEKLERIYCDLLVKYNTDDKTLANLWEKRESRGYGDTLKEMVRLGLAKSNETQGDGVLYGPFTRLDAAHYDETESIAMLFAERPGTGVMIDVGAHHGWALAPFLDMGWSIDAFEPDAQNRAVLLERLSKHKQGGSVSVDVRCVSNKSAIGKAFYRSDQSSGISGLSAFHETHIEAQRVDTISLADFYHGKEMPKVDFLKIDTEGHDLFVLEGFPWSRAKPAVIECEFEDAKTAALGYTFPDLANFLVTKGYAVYVSEWHPIIRYGIRHDWCRLARYPCQLLDPNAWGNLIAFAEPIDEQRLVNAVRKVLEIGAEGQIASWQKKNSNSLRAERTKDKLRCDPGAFFTRLSQTQWLYAHSNSEQRQLHLILDDYPVERESEFVGCVTLRSDKTMTVKVSLARHGSTPYEAAEQNVKLVPGAFQSILLKRQFLGVHSALRLQLDVVDVEAAAAVITINSYAICESLTSIKRRLSEDALTLKSANLLVRDGDYRTALGIYLILSQKFALDMYASNALYVARRLGMDSVGSSDDLIQMLA